MKAIVTVIGKDRVGIIAKVSNVLADNRVNIMDISQTILQDYFAMIMLVDLTEMAISFRISVRGWRIRGRPSALRSKSSEKRSLRPCTKYSRSLKNAHLRRCPHPSPC